jgi:hypothetical protein
MPGLCMLMATSSYDNICSSTYTTATAASSRQLQSCQRRQGTLPWRSDFPNPDGGEVSPLTLRIRVLAYSNSIYTESYPLLLTCYPD